MSMVLYTSPEVGYIVMDSLRENNTNDEYGVSIWYFSKVVQLDHFGWEACARLLWGTTCWWIRV